MRRVYNTLLGITLAPGGTLVALTPLEAHLRAARCGSPELVAGGARRGWFHQPHVRGWFENIRLRGKGAW